MNRRVKPKAYDQASEQEGWVGQDGERSAERATGLEPATSSLGSWHSTTELRPLGTAGM